MNPTALRATVVIAALYGHFLIFGQFAFVELLRGAGVHATAERALLGVMAVAGIGGGFFAAWRGVRTGMLRIALGLAGVSAGLAPFAGGGVALSGWR